MRVLLPPRSLEAELEEYERDDPTRTDVLAWSAATWLASLSLLRALEAALFAWLIFVLLFRFRASARVLRAAIWTPAFVLLVGYLLVTAAATLAYGRENMWSLAIPERKFLIPFLLVPVLHRWRLLLLGLVTGGAIEVAVMLCRAGLRVSVWPELKIDLVDGTEWTLVVLVAATMFAALRTRGATSFAWGALGLLTLSLQGMLSQRAPFVGALVALIATIVVGWRFFARGTRVSIVVAVPLLIGCAIAVSSLGGGVTAKRFDLLFESGDGGATVVEEIGPQSRTAPIFDYQTLNEYSSQRLELWRWTANGISEEPFIGHGRKAWRTEVDRLIDEAPAEVRAERGATIVRWAREIGYSHNTPLDVLFESGFIGAGLLVTLIALGLWGAFKRLREEPIAVIPIAAFVGLCAAAQFEFVFARSIQGATLISCAVLVLVPRPSAAQWERSGLGRSDAWIARLFGA
ncbi:MAG: O-Antigen ligase [Planctomycetota bacterium]|jgi:hypothetical protein